MNRCPICRGRNINNNAECQRCNADLTLLFQTEKEAARLLHLTFGFILNKNFDQAKYFLQASQSLVFSRFNQKILAFIEVCIQNEPDNSSSPTDA